MTISGKITVALPEANGTSKAGKNWRKRDYIVTYDNTNANYPKSIVFSVLNDNIEKLNIQQDMEYDLEIDFSTREYQGKYYLQASCWKATAKSAAQPAPAPTPQGWEAAYPQPSPQPQYTQPLPPPAQGDNLPF